LVTRAVGQHELFIRSHEGVLYLTRIAKPRHLRDG
jgi:hypothetical protein